MCLLGYGTMEVRHSSVSWLCTFRFGTNINNHSRVYDLFPSFEILTRNRHFGWLYRHFIWRLSALTITSLTKITNLHVVYCSFGATCGTCATTNFTYLARGPWKRLIPILKYMIKLKLVCLQTNLGGTDRNIAHMSHCKWRKTVSCGCRVGDVFSSKIASDEKMSYVQLSTQSLQLSIMVEQV